MEIVNKVAQSKLITIDLEDWYPKDNRITIDIKDILFQGLILREKDLREYVASTNFDFCKNSLVNIVCSADAVVPTWAYMLLTVHIQPHAKRIFYGYTHDFDSLLYTEIIENLDVAKYQDGKIIIKGCGSLPVPISAFVALTNKLAPIAKSIMYGEPCSTVPLFKRK
jgi:hypothetical protein